MWVFVCMCVCVCVCGWVGGWVGRLGIAWEDEVVQLPASFPAVCVRCRRARCIAAHMFERLLLGRDGAASKSASLSVGDLAIRFRVLLFDVCTCFVYT